MTCCLLPTAFCLVAFAQGGTGKLPRGPRNPPVRNPPPTPIANRFPELEKQLIGNWVEIANKPGAQMSNGTYMFSSNGSGIWIRGETRRDFRYRFKGDLLLTDLGNFRIKFDGEALKFTNVATGLFGWYARTNGKRDVPIVFRRQLNWESLDPPYEISGKCLIVTPGSRVEFGALLVQVNGTVMRQDPAIGGVEPKPKRVTESWYLSSPVNGTVVKVFVTCGQRIKDNQLLLTIRRD